MDNRKWEADAIVSPPTAPVSPSDGYPTNGDPGAAQNATEPGAWWFHAIGEELRAVIVEGGLTPSLSTLTQLRDAIKNIVKGGDYKESVRVASTAAINLAAPGANIDGVAMVAGDRFLEKDNATLANRGIYVWNGAAVAATRALDADTGAEFNGGAIIPVDEGTVNGNTNWQVTNDGTVTIGVTGLTFQSVGAVDDATTAVKGILKIATRSMALAGIDSTTAVPPSGLTYKIFQIEDTTDILLNNYATSGYSTIGSPFVVNIPSPGLIRFSSFAGRLLNNATATQHGVVFGIRIAGVNYWFTYLDSNGALSVVNQLNGGTTANVYTEWKGYEGAVPGVINQSNMAIPSGEQTVQLIAAYQTTQGTLKGTIAVTRAQLEILG